MGNYEDQMFMIDFNQMGDNTIGVRHVQERWEVIAHKLQGLKCYSWTVILDHGKEIKAE